MDVVIEHAVLVAVFVEQAEGVGIGKVFKLDEAVYSKPVGGRRELKMCFPRQTPACTGQWADIGQQVGVWGGSFTGVLATWLAPGLLGSAHLIIDENGEGGVGALGLVVSGAHLTVSNGDWWLMGAVNGRPGGHAGRAEVRPALPVACGHLKSHCKPKGMQRARLAQHWGLGNL